MTLLDCLLRFKGVLPIMGALALPAGVAGCMTAGTAPVATRQVDPAVVAMYGPVQDDQYIIPAINVRRIDPQYFRQVVMVPPNIPKQSGTIVVDPTHRFLYLMLNQGQAIRYGIGVGREGFAWSGAATVKSKQEWPKWFPPSDMMARDSRAARWVDGMAGGLDNPLGARALYLWQGKQDTLYRIHGTNEPLSIGHAVSSGCIRMFNQDVIDLYNRVPEGAKVIVLPAEPMMS
jgi:lipoprotein-anchoring transpeptidase ErfK/SrfK